MQAAVLNAPPCTLSWNPNPDTATAGYALYFGLTRSVTNRLEIGLTNLVTLNHLLASSNYFFYVVAYNAAHVESSPSVIINYSPPALSVLKFASQPNGTLNLAFQAATGAVCQVQYTPSLNPPNWQLLGSATADADGNVTINDPRTGNPPQRFYRAVLP